MSADEVGTARRLGELVDGHPEHVGRAVPELAALLAGSDDPDVLVAAVEALGHVWEPVAAAVLLDHVPPEHPDRRVRLALTQALPGGGVAADGELADRVVEALVTRTRDPEARIRDWAAFGLAQVEADTPAVRDALAALLEDPDTDARCEGLVALARIGDDRARTALLARLDAGADLTLLELEAAVALADPALHPALLRLAEDWAGDEDEFTVLVARAVARSEPRARDLARSVEQDVVETVRREVPGLARLEVQGTYPRSVLVCAREAGDPAVRLPLWADGEDPHADQSAAIVNATLGTLPAPRN